MYKLNVARIVMLVVAVIMGTNSWAGCRLTATISTPEKFSQHEYCMFAGMAAGFGDMFIYDVAMAMAGDSNGSPCSSSKLSDVYRKGMEIGQTILSCKNVETDESVMVAQRYSAFKGMVVMAVASNMPR